MTLTLVSLNIPHIISGDFYHFLKGNLHIEYISLKLVFLGPKSIDF